MSEPSPKSLLTWPRHNSRALQDYNRTRVIEIVPGLAAAESGLFRIGDILTEVDGKEVDGVDMFYVSLGIATSLCCFGYQAAGLTWIVFIHTHCSLALSLSHSLSL